MEEHLIARETSTYNGLSSLKAADTSYIFDVFLSFRGPDVRMKFVSHLYDRLKRVGFRVYLDEIEMEKGEEINEDLKRAMVNSGFCMPIFSKNYASSKACLLELSHMVQCEKKIIPIFYDATPDDVKLKTPLYKKDLEHHRDNPKVGLLEVERWEKALLTVAERCGYDFLNKDEAEEITAITHALLRLLPIDQDVTDKLVEIEDEVKCVERLLDLRSNGFRIVGILGMGGIGKTTLVKVLFNQLKSSFPGCCSFLEAVRENLQSNKLSELQRQLYKDVIVPSYAFSDHSHNDMKKMIKKGLKNKKVLLVLDDMNDIRQLRDLLGYGVHLTSESRIIITTRDRKVLEDLNQEHKNVQVYELNEMDHNRALKLFSKCAFMKDSPPKEFESISRDVVSYTGGFPLVLQVFGSLLSGQSIDHWKGKLEELKKFPDKSIETRLMGTYDGLRSNEQNIFLDIACHYGNLHREYACYMWEDCGWYPESAVKTLLNCSMIKIITDGYERYWMHDVLKDLGRALIQKEAYKSNRIPNRLRIDSLDILRETKERAHVETLVIDGPHITISREDMAGLDNLRFLELRVDKVQGDFHGIFPKLRWLSCDNTNGFHPFNFNPENILVFHLWTEGKTNWKSITRIKVDKLKALDIFSFTETDKSLWERLHDNFKWILNATDLEHDNFKWILNATDLESLRLSISYTITGLEEMGKLQCIKNLFLINVKFEYLQHLPSSLLHLTLSNCEFVDGVLDVSGLKNLIYFEFRSLEKLNEIKGIDKLHSLESLILAGAWKESEITRDRFLRKDEGIIDLSTLRKLRTLKVYRGGSIQGISRLESLEVVDIVSCDLLDFSLAGFSKLENLKSVDINCRDQPLRIEKKPFKRPIVYDNPPSQPFADNTCLESWSAPVLGFIKLNSNGAFDPGTRRTATGVIARNHRGDRIRGSSKLCKAETPNEAEALALLDAVTLAKLNNWDQVIFEVDSKIVFEAVHQKLNFPWRSYPIVADIISLISSFKSASFSLVKRNANRAAGWVATEAMLEKCPCDWVDKPPSPLSRILQADLLPPYIDM